MAENESLLNIENNVKTTIMAAMPLPAAVDTVITRGHKKRERTRRQLVAAAIDVIAERGEAFSISDITDRAEVSNGTFYNYFDDREQLIDAIVPEVLSTFAQRSAASVAATDPAERFATITALMFRRATVAPDPIRVLLRLDAVQRAIVQGRALDHLRADLDDGVTSGRFTIDIDDATIDVLVGALLLAARRLADQPVADHYEASVIERLLRMLGVAGEEAAELAREAMATADPVPE